MLLWGKGSIHSTRAVAAAFAAKLEHTMYLVQALCLGCLRTSSDTRADQMHEHLRNYLGQLTVIHPGAKHTANQHMSLHLTNFMKLYGPVHSWWTYPFERLIGRLQQLPTNNKFGTLSNFKEFDCISLIIQESWSRL